MRSRVEQCYSALQQGDWRKVEKYLTKESKPIFRSEDKKPLPAYQIESIKIEADGRTASVVVQIPIIYATAPKPVPVDKISLWRLIGGQWYMELPKADRNAVQQPPFRTMPKAPKGTPLLTVPYSKDLQFESTWCGLGVIKDSRVRVARFPFKNVTTHVVTLADMQLGCDCLVLKTKQMEYKPGESGTLEIEFDPLKLQLGGNQSFSQDIMFKTEPGGGYVKLSLGALVVPGPAPPANP